MRTVSPTLETAQSASSRTPYIKMVFTSADGYTTVDLSTDSSTYGNRIIGIDHHETAFEDFAYITLKDYDRTVPDMRGYWTEIGYGDTTGSGNEYSGTQTPRLWVMAQETIYASGVAIVILSLEGMWSLMKRKIAHFVALNLYDPRIVYGNYPATDGYDAREDFGASASLYDMMTYVIATMCNLTLNALTVDDGIIDEDDAVWYVVNDADSHQDCQSLLYGLITATLCVLRPEITTAFTVLYPKSEDAVDITFYNSQAPYFYEYSKKDAYSYPNNVYVFYGYDPDDPDGDIPLPAHAEDTASSTIYGNVYYISEHPEITSAGEAKRRADAILATLQREVDYGYLRIPHDGRIQLYDKVWVITA